MKRLLPLLGALLLVSGGARAEGPTPEPGWTATPAEPRTDEEREHALRADIERLEADRDWAWEQLVELRGHHASLTDAPPFEVYAAEALNLHRALKAALAERQAELARLLEARAPKLQLPPVPAYDLRRPGKPRLLTRSDWDRKGHWGGALLASFLGFGLGAAGGVGVGFLIEDACLECEDHLAPLIVTSTLLGGVIATYSYGEVMGFEGGLGWTLLGGVLGGALGFGVFVLGVVTFEVGPIILAGIIGTGCIVLGPVMAYRASLPDASRAARGLRVLPTIIADRDRSHPGIGLSMPW